MIRTLPLIALLTFTGCSHVEPRRHPSSLSPEVQAQPGEMDPNQPPPASTMNILSTTPTPTPEQVPAPPALLGVATLWWWARRLRARIRGGQ